MHVDTGDAYRRLAAARIANPAPVRPRSSSASLAVVTAVQRGDYDATIANTTNDFEPIVCAAFCGTLAKMPQTISFRIEQLGVIARVARVEESAFFNSE